MEFNSASATIGSNEDGSYGGVRSLPAGLFARLASIQLMPAGLPSPEQPNKIYASPARLVSA